MSSNAVDEYAKFAVKEPPDSFSGRLKFLGAGFILSASIVGSGELIATTTLGAKAGFVAFWIIIVSCIVKVAVQLEVAKHTIITGETAMQIFDRLPGPRIGKGRWSVWFIFLLILLKFIQLGGMVGSSAIVLNMLFASIPIVAWVFVCTILVSALIYNGHYQIIEKGSLILVGLFTILTIAAVVALNFTEYNISSGDIASGLTFSLNREILTVAIGAFGLTGVASDEIIAYNYWCLEKGYASYTGKRDGSPEWRRRVEGWTKVMYLDALAAMVIYTLVTAAFYLLGAAILHSRNEVPAGNALIETVAHIYTESLGEGIRISYLIGAFAVLFSSLFATLAAWTRIYPDIFERLGWVDLSRHRKKLIAILAWIIPLGWAFAFLFVNLPLTMILFGGAVGSIMLLMVVFAALHIKYARRNSFRSSRAYDVAFLVSVMSIAAVAIYGLAQLV